APPNVPGSSEIAKYSPMIARCSSSGSPSNSSRAPFELMRSAYFTIVPPSESVVVWMTNDSPRFRHPPQQCRRTGLVQVLVQVAALRALDARRAPALAGAAFQQADGVGDPALELLEASLRDPDSAWMPVVDEDRRGACVR